MKNQILSEKINEESQFTQLEKYLHSSFEQIIFNSEEMNTIKDAIPQIEQNKKTPKHLRELLFSSQVRIFREIAHFVNSYLQKQISNGLPKHKNEKTYEEGIGNISELQRELHEKEEFLEIIRQRLDIINQKLNHINTKSISAIPKKFLTKLQKLQQTADNFYAKEFYGPYLVNRYIKIELWISLFYSMVFKVEMGKIRELKIFDTLEAIERKLNTSFEFRKYIEKWRKIRNAVVHHGKEYDIHTANEGKMFFNAAEQELETKYLQYF